MWNLDQKNQTKEKYRHECKSGTGSGREPLTGERGEEKLMEVRSKYITHMYESRIINYTKIVKMGRGLS
jgi:hypothetical protein